MGGDTDTNCCIVGSVAEVMHGMNISQIKGATTGLPKEYIKILIKAYESSINSLINYNNYKRKHNI